MAHSPASLRSPLVERTLVKQQATCARGRGCGAWSARAQACVGRREAHPARPEELRALLPAPLRRPVRTRRHAVSDVCRCLKIKADSLGALTISVGTKVQEYAFMLDVWKRGSVSESITKGEWDELKLQ